MEYVVFLDLQVSDSLSTTDKGRRLSVFKAQSGFAEKKLKMYFSFIFVLFLRALFFLIAGVGVR